MRDRATPADGVAASGIYATGLTGDLRLYPTRVAAGNVEVPLEDLRPPREG
jgi:hypothetical protein